MAHDVSVMGAVYCEVPSVMLPDQTGTLNQFTDVSDTTATAADVAKGAYFYTSDGVRTAGTSEGGGGGGDDTDFANTIMRSGAITHIPDSVTKIGSYAFYGCTNLALTELPSGVSYISDNAFYYCANLALTELPSGVTYIGPSTFRGCSGLQQLDAQNVSLIDSNAFYSCSNLTELVLRESDTACKLNNVSAFAGTPMRGTSGKSGTIYVPQALIETYKAARNWSTIFNAGHLTFAAIEGSKWEL